MIVCGRDEELIGLIGAVESAFVTVTPKCCLGDYFVTLSAVLSSLNH